PHANLWCPLVTSQEPLCGNDRSNTASRYQPRNEKQCATTGESAKRINLNTKRQRRQEPHTQQLESHDNPGRTVTDNVVQLQVGIHHLRRVESDVEKGSRNAGHHQCTAKKYQRNQKRASPSQRWDLFQKRW